MTEEIKPGAQEDGTWILPAHRVPELQHRVGVLNRRVKKTGGAGLSAEVVKTFTEEVLDEDALPLVRVWAVLEVRGEVPVVDGWDFVARVEHHAGVGNIVSVAPSHRGAALPEGLRTAEATCDHCQTRRARKDTFVLRDGAGTFRQVGRSCLQDFLRGSDPEQVLRLWTLLSSMNGLLAEIAGEGYDAGVGRQGHVSTSRFLACVVSAIRHGGWVSKAMAEQDESRRPTAHTASWLCSPRPSGRAGEDWDSMQPADSDHDEAGEVLEWASGLGERADLNDYLHNVRVAVSIGVVEHRHAGLVASAVSARRRELETEVRLHQEAARPKGEAFGEPGKRSALPDLTVRVCRHLDGDYGVTTMIVMDSPDGSSFKWYASGFHDHKPGTVLRGKGTVKRHEEYKGRPVTVLTRCALVAVPEEAAAEEPVPF